MNKHNKLKIAVVSITRDDWQRAEILKILDEAVTLGRHLGSSDIKAKRRHKERMHEITMLSKVTPENK
jgi:hypothetical protein